MKANQFFTDRFSTLCKEWHAWEQASLKNKDSPSKLCAASVKVLTGYFFGSIMRNEAVDFLQIHKQT